MEDFPDNWNTLTDKEKKKFINARYREKKKMKQQQEIKQEIKPEIKEEVKPEIKPEIKEEVKIEVKPKPKPKRKIVEEVEEIEEEDVELTKEQLDELIEKKAMEIYEKNKKNVKSKKGQKNDQSFFFQISQQMKSKLMENMIPIMTGLILKIGLNYLPKPTQSLTPISYTGQRTQSNQQLNQQPQISLDEQLRRNIQLSLSQS